MTAGAPALGGPLHMRRTRQAVVATTLVLIGCGPATSPAGPGAQVNQHRTLAAATTVELATDGNLRLSTGPVPELYIAAGKNVIDHLTNRIRNGRLTLGADRSVGYQGGMSYDLVLPGARAVAVSGSGTFRVPQPSALQQITLSGSGDIWISAVTTDALAVSLGGSGRLTVAGTAKRQTVAIRGSGHYDGTNLGSQVANVTVEGHGSAALLVIQTLDADVRGPGSITYTGGATVHSRTEGGGTVTGR